MIRVEQQPDEQRRTGRGCPWIAECQVDGHRYEAASRSGAPLALARVLVAAGVPDQPVVVYSQGIAGHMRYPSLHKMAGFTVEESAARPAHLVRWKPRPDRSCDQDADLADGRTLEIGVKEDAG